ncbi:MAG: hypothetical protein FWC82_03865 [Firmicutes bacterium]|nr:hypothetical protein [Bacillota bacterium]
MPLKEIEKLILQIGELVFANREDVIERKYAMENGGLDCIIITMQSGKCYQIKLKEIKVLSGSEK